MNKVTLTVDLPGGIAIATGSQDQTIAFQGCDWNDHLITFYDLKESTYDDFYSKKVPVAVFPWHNVECLLFKPITQ